MQLQKPILCFLFALAVTATVYTVAVAAADCKSPYFRLNNRCIYYNISRKVNWCEAANLCLAIEGELAVDLELIRDVRCNVSTGTLWIGATDLLDERATNRSGWRWTNGSVLGAQDSDWRLEAPNNAVASDDFLAVNSNGINDVRFEYERGYVCQPIATPRSHRFKHSSFLRLGDISPNYCFTDLFNVQRETGCVLRCADRWQCRAALYNSADARCRMLDFADASVGDNIELDPNWIKLVKVY